MDMVQVASRARAKPEQPPSPGSQAERDSYSVTALADITDRSLHAALARFTLGEEQHDPGFLVIEA